MFDKYPFTDFHELNLDWVIKTIKELGVTLDEWVVLNEIKFADPITFDVAKSYAKSTIVLGSDGNTYISKQNVNAGHSLDEIEYWQEIASFNAQLVEVDNRLSDDIDDLRQTMDNMYEKVVYTAEMFGAVGDGVADDTDAIIDAMASGKAVYFAPKTYRITRQFAIPAGATLNGDNTTFVFDNINNVTAIINTLHANDITIKGIKFDGRTQTSLKYLVSFIDCDNLVIDNCEFTGGYGYALRINESKNVSVTNCYAHHITGAESNPGGFIFLNTDENVNISNIRGEHVDDHFIYLVGEDNGCHDINISDCNLEYAGESALTAGAAIVLYANTYNVNINNCIIQNCRDGIDSSNYGTSNYRVHDISIRGCTIVNTILDGISFIATPNNNIYRLIVDSCDIVNCGQDGIKLRYCHESRINNNIVKTTGRNCIELSSQFCEVTNNHCIDMDEGDVGIIVGYVTDATDTPSSNLIMGNIIQKRTGTGANALYNRNGTNNRYYNNTILGSYTISTNIRGVSNIVVQSEVGQRSITFENGAPAGYHNVGDIVFNSNPSSTGAYAWICTAAGAPGTFRTLS